MASRSTPFPGLHELLRPAVIQALGNTLAKNIVTLHGGMGAKQRHRRITTLHQIPDGTERVLIATGRYLGEGFDDARLGTLFLAMPASWKGTLAQYAGSLHRLHLSKVEVVIYDYVDSGEPVLARMAAKRPANAPALSEHGSKSMIGLNNPAAE